MSAIDFRERLHRERWKIEEKHREKRNKTWEQQQARWRRFQKAAAPMNAPVEEELCALSSARRIHDSMRRIEILLDDLEREE